jgi:hypothetical protein
MIAPIAAEAGPRFRRDRTCFFADRYHPSAGGCAIWAGLLNCTLDQALREPSGHELAGKRTGQ